MWVVVQCSWNYTNELTIYVRYFVANDVSDDQEYDVIR